MEPCPHLAPRKQAQDSYPLPQKISPLPANVTVCSTRGISVWELPLPPALAVTVGTNVSRVNHCGVNMTSLRAISGLCQHLMGQTVTDLPQTLSARLQTSSQQTQRNNQLQHPGKRQKQSTFAQSAGTHLRQIMTGNVCLMVFNY